MSLEDTSITPDYARDIDILDAEPWNGYGPVDELIDLQKQTFVADTLRDHRHVATLYLEMAGIERSLGNGSEAIGYTQDAVEAFEEAKDDTSVQATLGTLSREYRLTNTPDLALGALNQAVARLTAGNRHTITATDLEATATMLSRMLENYRRIAAHGKRPSFDSELAWARPIWRDVQMPSSNAMGELHEAVDSLLDVPVQPGDDWAFRSALNLVRWVYIGLAAKDFGLSRRDGKRAYVQSKRLLGGMGVVYAQMPQESDDSLPFMDGWSAVSMRDFLNYCNERHPDTMRDQLKLPTRVQVPLDIKVHRSRRI